MKQKDNWIFALKEDDLGNGEMKPLLIDSNKVLVLRIDDGFFAMSNKCPHMECPLSKGTLEQYVIKCPCHDWRFDVREGKFLDAEEIRVPIYETKVMEDGVFVNLSMEGAGK